ncbi:hypothetical protein A9200_14695 [Maribacter hydrothermalis]|uniref:Uncharacterized protein n=1 Tax=Maribacter hydrothermalis TaxID=1836467 RepID=A0A1B7ZCI1_9FLAO|nr:hypothetical protein A9200_14695 [Maribacter hydrothermalis]
MKANIKDGIASIRLSLILMRTANPKIINTVNPVEAIKTKTGEKKKPYNKPLAPSNCKYPVNNLLFLPSPNLINSCTMCLEIKQFTP